MNSEKKATCLERMSIPKRRNILNVAGEVNVPVVGAEGLPKQRARAAGGSLT